MGNILDFLNSIDEEGIWLDKGGWFEREDKKSEDTWESDDN